MKVYTELNIFGRNKVEYVIKEVRETRTMYIDDKYGIKYRKSSDKNGSIGFYRSPYRYDPIRYIYSIDNVEITKRYKEQLTDKKKNEIREKIKESLKSEFSLDSLEDIYEFILNKKGLI